MKDNNNEIVNKITGPQPPAVWVIIASVALLMIVAGTLIPLFNAPKMSFMHQPQWFRYVYSAGALLLLISRLFTPYKGSSIRVKRLSRIELWSALFFCVGAFFLFYEPENGRNWLAFTMAGGAIQIYSSFMIPRAIKKAVKEAQNRQD